MKTATILAALIISGASLNAGDYIKDRTDDGSVIILGDGTMWKVSTFDRYDTRFWSSFDSVVEKNGKLINVDKCEAVDATQIR